MYDTMKKILLLLALALLPAAAGYAQKVVHLNRYAEANAALAAPQGARVVLFGDSITDAWASQRPEFFAENGFIGRGISGEVTAQMLLRFRQDVLDIGATCFVLLAGINDIAQNLGDDYNEDSTFANIESMVELAQVHGVRPVLCTLLHSTQPHWRPEITDTYDKVLSLNARIRAYCEAKGITCVDYGPTLAGPDGRISPEFSGDTVHPNAAGYEMMEKLLYEAL